MYAKDKRSIRVRLEAEGYKLGKSYKGTKEVFNKDGESLGFYRALEALYELIYKETYPYPSF